MRSWSCLLVHTRLTIQTTMLSGPKDSRFKTLKRLPSATRATVPTVPQLLDKDSNVHCKADRSSVHSLPRTYCLHTCRQATHELNAHWLQLATWKLLPGNFDSDCKNKRTASVSKTQRANLLILQPLEKTRHLNLPRDTAQ